MWETIIIQPFTNVLLLINSLVHNFGVAIILFTILIRLITHPLTVSQFKATKAMQDLQEDPRYKKIQQKYKNDRDKLAQEQMKLYQEKGVKPLGSCLPTLIQLPIILGLYQSVTKAMASSPYELFQLEQIVYPKLIDAAKLLPLEHQFLWMDLGQPERVTIFGLSIPLLAIIVVLTTYLQSKLLQPPTSKSEDQAANQAAMLNKSMSIYMPVLMGFMAYSLASGLAIYFLTSNIFGIVQYAILGRANWSNILPFLKKKEADGKAGKGKAEIVDVEPEDILDDEEEEEEEEKLNLKPVMAKKKRPQMKKRK
jgi:YidC/Oxa1 family membrane protein insertase